MGETKNIDEKAYVWGHVGVIIFEVILYFIIALLAFKIYTYKIIPNGLTQEKTDREYKKIRNKFMELNNFYFKKYALVVLIISIILIIVTLLSLVPVLKKYDKIIIE